MPTPLKDLYSPAFYNTFAYVVAKTIDGFDKKKFIKAIYTSDFDAYELKERMSHTAKVLRNFLPEDYDKSSDCLMKIVENLIKDGITENSLEYMFIPEFIAMYGLQNYDKSVKAMEYVTQFTSCEFAVRPFILKYPEKMIKQMLSWSKHTNNKVRRLASEGSRPRLPWAMALPFLKTNPEPILPILENLKQDSCEIVRRSVANNINDISKDNPHVVIQLIKHWKGISPETDAIIKHGCRTLLKQGNTDILDFFKLNDDKNIIVSNFEILTLKVKIGNDLKFSFEIHNKSKEIQIIRLEYGLYYLRQNGSLSKKVFKISEKQYQANEKVNITRKQSFRIITTRVFYAGEHKLSVIVNGKEKVIGNFELCN